MTFRTRNIFYIFSDAFLHIVACGVVKSVLQIFYNTFPWAIVSFHSALAESGLRRKFYIVIRSIKKVVHKLLRCILYRLLNRETVFFCNRSKHRQIVSVCVCTVNTDSALFYRKLFIRNDKTFVNLTEKAKSITFIAHTHRVVERE